MKNKNRKRSSNKIPFSNETKQIKYEFIKFIESMTDNEFLDFIILFSCFVEYMELLDAAFDPKVEKALDGSVALAKYMGVPDSEILDDYDKIASYFLD